MIGQQQQKQENARFRTFGSKWSPHNLYSWKNILKFTSKRLYTTSCAAVKISKITNGNLKSHHFIKCWLRVTMKWDQPQQCLSYITHIFIWINPIQDGPFWGCSRKEDWEGQKGLISLKSYNDETWSLSQLCFTKRRSKKYMNYAR